MKKFFICIFILILPIILYSQETKAKNYIDGYEELEWGSSVEKVKSKFPDLIKLWDADCMTNEECYTAESGKVSRVFRFYKNKLYWVRVIYEDFTQTQYDALWNKLIEKYGSLYYPIDSDEKIKFGYQWLLFTDLIVTVSVNNQINGFRAKLGEWVFVTYNSRSITKEMQTAASDDIEL
ncbi:hypothetical protein [Treponema sp. C6A8]|uniref:hypothetical protein n=1 Tax=Treponema sp. C6A8 TaxID=1410609 RepID=UPI000480B1D1|nr:hypothetical protein [Treponema sp. C6A8]